MRSRKVLGLLCSALLLFALAGCALTGSVDKGTSTGNETDLEGLDQYSFTWRRTGGLVGFCDVVTVSGDGTGAVYSCISDPSELVGEATLTPEMIEQLNNWLSNMKNPIRLSLMP